MRPLTRLLAGVAIAALCAPAGSAYISCPAVTSAGSFRLGMPPKGSIASIWCTGLSVHGIVLAETLPLPFELAGIQVSVGGAPAPLLGLAEGPGYQQINIQVPLEAQFPRPSESCSFDCYSLVPLEVEQDGQRGLGFGASFSSPGEFFLWPGTNFGIFQHAEDYSLVTPDNPARPGETLYAYLTGMPATLPTGQPAPPVVCVSQFNYGDLWDLYTIYDLDRCSGGACLTAAEVQWACLVPGLVGVYQMRLVLQPSVAAGNRRIELGRGAHWMFGYIDGGVSSPVVLPVR